MNPIQNLFLKIARKSFTSIISDINYLGRNRKMHPSTIYAQDLISSYIDGDKPFMIARLGSTELLNLVNYIGVKNKSKYKSYKGFITGKTPPWWWEKTTIDQLKNWSGFFPADINHVEKFCEMMMEDLEQLDVLGSWRLEEKFFYDKITQSKRLFLEDLEPFFVPNPWTKSLKGKKVLVIHPFVDTFVKQYQKKDLIFDNELLPDFDLKVIKAVQSLGGTGGDFSTWFDSLNWMKNEMDKTDYDICIIGCGAYGFPLAAHAKRMGKKAIHLGGVTQLLFGVKGRRWEDNFLVKPYINMFNKHWVRPEDAEKPASANSVEGACYW